MWKSTHTDGHQSPTLNGINLPTFTSRYLEEFFSEQLEVPGQYHIRTRTRTRTLTRTLILTRTLTQTQTRTRTLTPRL